MTESNPYGGADRLGDERNPYPKKKFQIGTDLEGTVEVELKHGCGHNDAGVSVLFNGVCVVHFTGELNSHAKMDVYSTAARVAGLNWVDIFTGEPGNTKCEGNF